MFFNSEQFVQVSSDAAIILREKVSKLQPEVLKLTTENSLNYLKGCDYLWGVTAKIL